MALLSHSTFIVRRAAVDGSSPVIYSLLPSATAVKKDKAGVVSPSAVSCQVELRVGNEREIIGATNPDGTPIEKIDFKGRNLLVNSAPLNLVGWAANGSGQSFDTSTGRTVIKLGSQAGSGYYRDGLPLELGQEYTVSYDVFTDVETVVNVCLEYGEPASSRTIIKLNEWQRITFTQVCNRTTLIAYRGATVAAGVNTYVKDIQISKAAGTISSAWIPAPEDYTIRRDGEAYTAGTAVAPTGTINWSLHDPSKATEAEPIGRASTMFSEDIEIGGVNLALNSKDFSFYTNINLTGKLVAGESYTLSIGKSTSLTGSQTKMLLYNHNPISGASSANYIDFGESKRLTFVAVASNLLLYAGELWASGNSAKIEKLMLTRGNKSTDWSPAPEDVQGEIDGAKASIADIFSDGRVTPDEKQQLRIKFDPIIDIQRTIQAKCATLNVDCASLTTLYGHLSGYLTPLLAAMTTTDNGSFDQINTRFRAWEAEYSLVQVRVAEKLAAQAAAEAEAAAKAEAAKRQNDLAASIGYASWADLEATAAAGQTIISGGKINTTLIETAALVAKLLHADSGFIDKLTVNSLRTPGGEVEINSKGAKFGAAEVQGDGSVAIKNTSGDEITKLVRGEIDDLEAILGKNQNTGDVAIPQLGGNGDLRPTGGSWENPQWTERATAAAVTAAYDGTTITIKGASMSMGVGLYVPGTHMTIRVKAELRNALGGSWLIAEQSAQYYYDYPGRNTTIPLERTFTGMPKGAYRLVISAVIQSWNGDWTTAGQLAASFGGGGGTMSAVFTNAANQSILGRGLSVMRSATEFLHLGWDKALGAVGGRKWGLTYRGAMDIPGVLAQYKVQGQTGTIFNASRFGAKAVGNGVNTVHTSSGVFTIPHTIGHTNYSVSVAFEKFNGFWSVQEMATNSVTIGIANHQNSAYADPNFYITITGNNS